MSDGLKNIIQTKIRNNLLRVDKFDFRSSKITYIYLWIVIINGTQGLKYRRKFGMASLDIHEVYDNIKLLGLIIKILDKYLDTLVHHVHWFLQQQKIHY